MLPYNVTNKNQKKEQGFTLIETLATVMVLGVLAAISAPNLWEMYQQNYVSNAVNELRSKLQEAQRVAIRNSKDCSVTLPSSGASNGTITSTCLSNSLTLENSVTIRHNYSSPANTITFNYKGETSTQGTIVLNLANVTEQKCLVTSIGLGLMRTGEYLSTETSGTPSADNCTTAQ
jgi:prepilin-type N-terminal cleavage/methylation domain-containing protein